MTLKEIQHVYDSMDMAVKPKRIDWWDIFWHCLIAVAWAGLCGYVAGRGYSYAMGAGGLADQVFGWALVGIFTLAGIIGNWLFWLGRERQQHGYAFGGRQSQLEWIAPAGVTALAFGVGFVIGA